MQARQSLADIQFLLNDVLNAPAQWRALAPLANTDGELAAQVLEEAAKFVDGTIAPLQRSGDEEGCRFDAGRVHTPAGFRDAYQAFWQGGWPALACAPEPSASAQAPSPPANPDLVVAEVGGRTVTLKELDAAWEEFDAAERARVTQMLYQNRRNVLEQMVGDLLIESAAKEAGQTVEAFLAADAAK